MYCPYFAILLAESIEYCIKYFFGKVLSIVLQYQKNVMSKTLSMGVPMCYCYSTRWAHGNLQSIELRGIPPDPPPPVFAVRGCKGSMQLQTAIDSSKTCAGLAGGCSRQKV